MNKRISFLALTGILTLAACSNNSTPTNCAAGQNLVNGVCVTPSVTTGSLNLVMGTNVTATVTNSAGAVVPASSYAALAPGAYTVVFSQTGYTSSSPISFNITAGNVTTVQAPTLTAVGKSTAYYVDAAGKMVAITTVDPSKFHFSAWLQDKANGIDPTKVGTSSDAGLNTSDEQNEVAPLNTQNIAGAYMTYTPDGTNYFPVVGANVNWAITEQTGSTRFSAADDGSAPSGAISQQDINDGGMSAATWTNRAGSGTNVAFPASAQYPTYNQTGVGTADTSGFTWTALNHDPKYTSATARVRVIGYVNGQEITKQWLNKTFAPSAKLVITKTFDNANSTPGVPRTATITITNTGQGAATGINLQDRLTSGAANLYSIGNVTGGGTLVGNSGFNSTFDLAPGANKVFTLQAQASDTGVFCDTAAIVNYNNGAFGLVTPSAPDLTANACVTVQAPKLVITKTAVDANNNPITATVAAGTPVKFLITVKNNGTLDAQGVAIADAPAATGTTGNPANYSITAPTGTTATGKTGFTAPAQTIAVGASVSYAFNAVATSDGTFCDTGSFTSTNAGNGSADACLTVATARLQITKTNTTTANLYPGSSYGSTITVTNTGTAAATNVNVNDIIGKSGNNFVGFGSGNYTVTGTAQPGSVSYDAASHTATIVPSTVSIPAGGNLTLNITSTVPTGTTPGQYCDVASFVSTNSQPANGTAQACINVAAYLSEQTQNSDTVDPIHAGDATGTIVTSTASVEPMSNENAINNVFQLNFGAKDPTDYGNISNGAFNFKNIVVYFDPNPVRDAVTGVITSNENNASSRVITPASVTPGTGTGKTTVTLDPNFALTIGGVVFIKTQVAAPAGTAPGQYQEVFRWTNTGQADGQQYINQKAESTTVIP